MTSHMTDPFLIRVPAKLANDPELGPYFNYLSKVLHDLTVTTGDAIPNPSADVDSLKIATDLILARMRTDGDIKP